MALLAGAWQEARAAFEEALQQSETPEALDGVAGAAGWLNDGLLGGSAPVCAHIPELLDDALEGRIDPGRVLDFETGLDGIAEAYAAMDERRGIKSLLRRDSIKRGRL
jgi:threonine dehydrogenase-like Zn-dependent dehydrogenase